MAVKSERFLELPIRDGNPLMLAVLSPGVVNVSEGGTYRPYDNENSSAISVDGSSAVDGVPGLENPALGAAGGVDGVERAAFVADVDVSVQVQGWRRDNRVISREQALL